MHSVFNLTAGCLGHVFNVQFDRCVKFRAKSAHCVVNFVLLRHAQFHADAACLNWLVSVTQNKKNTLNNNKSITSRIPPGHRSGTTQFRGSKPALQAALIAYGKALSPSPINGKMFIYEQTGANGGKALSTRNSKREIPKRELDYMYLNKIFKC